MKILLNGKRYFLLAGVFLLLTSANIFAQIEKDITEIRTEVTAINKGASKYKKTTKNVEGISLEGTEATYFFAAESLKKITAKMYGESFNATGEFYYRGGELIFAYVKHNKYAVPIGSGSGTPKVISTEEQRFYFGGGELIRLLIGKKELKSADERYSELKDQIVGISKELKDS